MEEKKGLTKAERKQIKLQKNQEWIHNYRSNGIEQEELNRQYSSYYQIQLADCFRLSEGNVEKNMSQWEEFTKIMKQPLPVTFRISERLSPKSAKLLHDWIMKNFPQSQKLFTDHNLIEANISPIHWCPSTFQLSIDNHTLLNQKSLVGFNQFLSRECQLGRIIRQELVSMIPVLFLDLHYDHVILDCCAAPGSKTEQILASLEKSYRVNAATTGSSGAVSSGCLVANDTDQKRIHELIRKFSSFPSPQLLFTNMNGEVLSTYFHQDRHSPAPTSLETFDRILCDVPCSGDGTFRKSPHLWRLFRPRTAISFHLIQRQILLQALLVLKPGGRLVYSTCSLNPIEDESVVASVLADYGLECIRLIDVSQSTTLQQLKYRPGLSSWRSDQEIFMLEESEAERKETLKRLPELPNSIHVPKQVENYHLERCLRILPHDQNTGGFFIAVFEKLTSVSKEQVHRQWKVATDKVRKVSSATKDRNNSDSKSSSLILGSSNSSATVIPSSATTSLKAMKEIGFNPKPLYPSLKPVDANGLCNPRFLELSNYSPELYDRIIRLLPLPSHSVLLVDLEKDESQNHALNNVYLVGKRVYELSSILSIHSYSCPIFAYNFREVYSISTKLPKIYWNNHFFDAMGEMNEENFPFLTLVVPALEDFQDLILQQIQSISCGDDPVGPATVHDNIFSFGIQIPDSLHDIDASSVYFLSDRGNLDRNDSSSSRNVAPHSTTTSTTQLFSSWRKLPTTVASTTPSVTTTKKDINLKLKQQLIRWALERLLPKLEKEGECMISIAFEVDEEKETYPEQSQQRKRRLSKAERKALSKRSKIEISLQDESSIKSRTDELSIPIGEKASGTALNRPSHHVFRLSYHAQLHSEMIKFTSIDSLENLISISEYLLK